MKLIPRLVTAGAGALALMLVMGGAAAPAQAAGGPSVVVGSFNPFDCNYNNIISSNLQTAIDLVPQPKAITVCPGVYDPITITGKSNMKITGLGYAGIVPAGSPFTGPIVYVHNSINITIQGFFVDGDDSIGVGAPTGGIVFDESSGTITKNHILRIRDTPMGSAGDPVEDGFVGIWVGGTGGQKVKIVSNTVDEYQSVGIYATGNVNVTVSKNLVSSVTPCPCSIPEGIVFDGVSAGSISGNKIKNDYYAGFGNTSLGIEVYASSKIKVTKNTIEKTEVGIVIDSDGDPASPGAASLNTISGNTLSDVPIGILVQAEDNSTITASDPHADLNKITGNKLVFTNLDWVIGIAISEDDDIGGATVFIPSAFKNTISGNKLYGYCACGIDPGPLSTILGKNSYFLPPTGASAAPSAGGPDYSLPAFPHHIPYVDWQ